ncbi:EF-hand domain-containing protein [Plasmodiophora brassicae]|nr:hypothetical protein PBRA_009430 [Plasmodiophora brassicae]
MPQATSRSSPALRQRSASPTGRKVGAAAHHATGGIHVQRAELQQAFDFFDVTKKGYLTMDDLKARLPIFYSNVPVRELKFLMNNKSELTFNDLYELLADNTLTNFDPAAEAFKVYDPKSTGFVSTDVLRDILGKLGLGDITDDDIKVVVETADVDGDGKIGLEDFRKMLSQKLDLSAFKSEQT